VLPAAVGTVVVPFTAEPAAPLAGTVEPFVAGGVLPLMDGGEATGLMPGVVIDVFAPGIVVRSVVAGPGVQTPS